MTGTRADYGIMAPVMRAIAESGKAELQVVATNMHLSERFGMTVNEVEADGFRVDARVDSLLPGDRALDVAKSMAGAEAGLADAFEELRPDLVVVLGDRYEALAAASVAVVFNIPVAHLHGGETTEGAIDDRFRHAITQLSTYHFAATPQYVDKIISLGARPEYVFHSGAPGAEIREEGEDMRELALEFEEKTGIRAGEAFILFAFHPVTILEDKGIEELKATLEAMAPFIKEGYRVLVTLPNSDPGNEGIRSALEDWASRYPEVSLVKSLGSRLFHYAMEYGSAMVGNSSAALIEAPSHRLGAVNVGIRQKGRAHGLTVVDAPGDAEKIGRMLKAVMSLEMKSVLLGMSVASLNPYYKENSAAFIANKLIDI